MTTLNLLLFLRRHWLVFAIAAALALTYAKGHHDGSASEKRAEAVRLERARKLVIKREATAEKITQAVKSDLAKTQVQIRYRTVTLIEKVPVYVSPESDARCTVPVGFVRLHNDAASLGGASGVSEPAGRSGQASSSAPSPEVLSADSGVQLSEVGAVIVENYGTAAELREEVIAWRRWWGEQSAAWAKR